MVYGKDRATGKNAEDPADIVEQLDKEGGDDMNLDDDNNHTYFLILLPKKKFYGKVLIFSKIYSFSPKSKIMTFCPRVSFKRFCYDLL